MATKRRTILNVIKTVLEGVSVLKKVMLVVDEHRPDVETAPMPFALIHSGGETRVPDGIIGSETWKWECTIEIWARSTDMEALLGTIHAAMFANYRFDANAHNSYRTGAEIVPIPGDDAVQVMLIDYSITYRHTLGDMEN